MPRAAFGLKKNRGGHWASTMADNEHATAALGDSEILAVQYPVGPPVPAIFQSREERPEVAPVIGTKKPWNILKQQPSGLQFVGHPQEFPEEAAAFPGEPSALAGDGKVLAGEAAAEEINVCPGIPFSGSSVSAFATSCALQISGSSVAVRMCERTNVCASISRFIPVALPLPHVSPAGNVWPVTLEHPLAEGVDLALEGAGPSGAFEPEVKAAYPTE